MIKSLTLAASLSLIVLTTAYPAMAQDSTGQCANRLVVAEALKTKYGEKPRVVGLSANNTVMEIWVNDDTGTWTATVTMPDMTTCMVMSGDNLEEVAPGDPA